MEVLELVERAREGDREAFSALEKRYRRPVCFLSARFLANRAEAEEVTDAVFSAAREKLPRLKDASLFYGWLEWTAAKECRERLRQRLPSVFRERREGGRGSFPSVPEEGEPVRVTEERIKPLIAAADALPAPQRVPLFYTRYCGYSVEEAAVFLGLDEDTVGYRIRAAESALYEAALSVPGCRYAGIDDIFEAFREYAAKGSVSAAEEPLFEEEKQQKEKRNLPFALYAVLAAVAALVVFFAVYLIKERKAEKQAERETPHSYNVSVAAPEGGQIARTAVPATPTPVPTPSPTPEPVRPDVSYLDTQPYDWEYLEEPAAVFVCVQGSMNVRNGTGTKFKSVGTLSSGASVMAVAAHEGWYLCEYTDGRYGWASGGYLVAPFMFRDGTNPALAGITAPENGSLSLLVKSVTGGNGAPLYRDPSGSGSLADTVPFGEKVCLLTADGDWVFVNYSGRFGWMKQESFDESNTMGVSNGTYFFTVPAGTYWEERSGFVTAQGTLYRRELLTPANAKKYVNGETVKTKKGTKLNPSFSSYASSAAFISEGVPVEYTFNGGEISFVYDTAEKAYAVYEYGTAKLYAYKAVTLLVESGATVTDNWFYPLLGTGRPAYATKTEEGMLTLQGSRLAEYTDYLSLKGVQEDFTGRVTVRNGAILSMTLEDIA